jgi:hypothetical protein
LLPFRRQFFGCGIIQGLFDLCPEWRAADRRLIKRKFYCLNGACRGYLGTIDGGLNDPIGRDDRYDRGNAELDREPLDVAGYDRSCF